MPDINLQEIHDTLVEVAFEAGFWILAANPNNIDKGSKMNCVCLSLSSDFFPGSYRPILGKQPQLP